MQIALVLAVGVSPTAMAQVRPQPSETEPRLQTVPYSEGQVVLLELAPGYQMTLELAQDEKIENVAIGDSNSWQVTANRRGDRLFIKALAGGAPTNLTVITESRLYAIELYPLGYPSPDMAYIVRYRYPEAEANAGVVSPAMTATYRVSGDRVVRPLAVSDDGVHTYVAWGADAGIPAVYSVDPEGRESLVNGTMRDGLFVIDAVSRRLVFRVDNKIARAVRRKPRKTPNGAD